VSGREHTAGEWKAWSVSESRLTGGHHGIESTDKDANEGSVICEMSGPDGETNAEFICRAVNCHDDLVGYLDQLQHRLSRLANFHGREALSHKADTIKADTSDGDLHALVDIGASMLQDIEMIQATFAKASGGEG